MVSLPAVPVSVVPDGSASPSADRFGRGVDRALRFTGGVLAVVGGVLSAVLELLLAPLRVGDHLVGVSVLVAVGMNVALSWFAHATVGRRWAVALPAVPWFFLVAVAGIRTTEGDVLLTGTWVDLLLVVAGAMTFAVLGFRQILAAAPPGRT
ncbi:hypothetical protein [Salinispora arenicola]|uniref:Uncharacterized protein n=1 Tax=Salinispora arenicola TaxID=168697 RepID=A0A542XMW0_SALAC|nr:hypothetical protein [Salinispora arenicola]MCN0152084.1 hypothetical protein [Salinispora arenicola]MCN0177583.1 hypothetical protein [Salinispora arenicola]NIL39875.1 hypothetical protein [Salinispora arenicola]NIL56634.1 hypothetical protein [Salinispora arenicola]NIL61593.1 hypothetical protein [Salinispora arenicola]